MMNFNAYANATANIMRCWRNGFDKSGKVMSLTHPHKDGDEDERRRAEVWKMMSNQTDERYRTITVRNRREPG